jgi:SAM-dependent methyltransferase
MNTRVSSSLKSVERQASSQRPASPQRNPYAQTVREVARHFATRLGLRPAFARLKGKKKRPTGEFLADTRGETFQRIYRDGIWTQGIAGSIASGPGSSLDATAAVRRDLPELLNTVGARTLLDVGCGDQVWIAGVDLRQRYVGVDIVPEMIEENKRHYPERQYFCLDAVTADLPDADTVLCREVLFHLSLDDGMALLRNLARKRRKFLIATTDIVTMFNADVPSGDFRFLNLNKRPFNFPEPDLAIADDWLMSGRRLAAWRFDRLPL